jgi:hypothetical protein
MTITFRETPLNLNDFAGNWRFGRVVSDADGQVTAEVDGQIRFDAGEGGLVCVETGQMRIGSGPALKAERRTIWRDAGDGRIAVFFADGKPFHSFDSGAAWAEARHDCTPDIYRVVYDFSAFPSWTSIWRVSGPRKAYLMTSRMQRP